MPPGQHKVFLGMAVGVGKTYRMLEEGHVEVAKGHDVVIGLLETHDRPETAALAEGIEVIPRRRVPWRGSQFEELDLPALLRRAPAICLIDELAHTNTPGLEHRKRYEDVAELLAAGITVFSTVNVQHLESVAGRIGEQTGIVIQETVPDGVVDDADEVVVVDLSPEALRTRIAEGKVLPPGSVQRALEGFFNKENLAVLREIALLQVVEEVEAQRLDAETLNADERLANHVAAARQRRFLGLIKPDLTANRIVRRAWTMAERLGGDLDLLWVTTVEPAEDPEARRAVAELHRLAAVFGAHLFVETDRDVAAAVARVVAERRPTQIVMGTPHRHRRLLRRNPRSLVDEITARYPSLDIVLVGDPPGTDEAERPVEGQTAG
jgi:two-component system, OmpR family, sensor histidine kinase KdpD